MEPAAACLYVCVTCRDPADPESEGERPGARLYAALAAGAPPVALHPVECLANCARGCSAAIAMPGKWSYLLGGLRPELAGDLIDYARLYVASRTGTIMPSRRAPSLAGMIVGRIPSAEPMP